ncbi:MAG: pyruvate dehydrogenase (acetyl-transferring), homodimeric type, partial [Pseudomonadota bacterium]
GLFGSGSIMQQVLAAQTQLSAEGIAADVWSVTSYSLLYRDAVACEAQNRAHPNAPPRTPWLLQALGSARGHFVAASDYMKVLPASIAQWLPGPLACLGTDGYGLSESREALRDHFGVDAAHIVAAVHAARRGQDTSTG